MSDAAKTGMLATAPIMHAIAEVVQRLRIPPFVVDPVAASQHGDPLLREDAFEALRDVIIPLATLVTPNLNEVRLLTGLDVHDLDGMREAAVALKALGPQWVLVKGGHLEAGDAVDVLYDGVDLHRVHGAAARHRAHARVRRHARRRPPPRRWRAGWTSRPPCRSASGS